MLLKGIHHITAITGDAPGNVDFYVRVLGLRMVKKTVNFDAPDVYHLYFADETGTPGSVLTFFEYPGASPGRHGPGMIHTIQWGVATSDALDFWEQRLGSAGVDCARLDHRLVLADPEGLGIELVVDPDGQAALAASWHEVPEEFALRGFAGVRVYGRPGEDASGQALTQVLGFEGDSGSDYRLTAGPRTATYRLDPPPPERGIQGAGSVHHIAWACEPQDQQEWRRRAAEAELRPTPIIDRQYFRSIYFREPGGVLFEIATLGPGFDIDEPLDALGESLQLPPQHEHLRAVLEQRLTPLTNPRQP